MAKCKRVPLSSLVPGAILRTPITDPNNPRIKLLNAGIEITHDLLDALEARGVVTVVLSQRDLGILNAFKPQGRRTKAIPPHQYVTSDETNDYAEHHDKQILRQDTMHHQPMGDPFSTHVRKPDGCGYDVDVTRRWGVEQDEVIDRVNEFYDESEHGKNAGSIAPLKETCEQILAKLSEDQDALLCLACAPYESEYPSRHGIHVASVAVGVGAQMELDHQSLLDLAMGCLVHDIGMRLIGLGIFQTKAILSSRLLQILSNHPVRAIKAVGEMGDGISELAKTVAYQIHERCDGSGYPRGWTDSQIHPLAKIAAVADAFVGMLTRRPHRLAIQGYYVMEQLLSETSEGKFDPKVVRSLLNVTSLYPLGSFVELNNGGVGRVIRAGGGDFVSPTIEMWGGEAMLGDPAIVNLKHEPTIKIVGSIPALSVPSRKAA